MIQFKCIKIKWRYKMKKLHLTTLIVASTSMIMMSGCVSTGSQTGDGALIGAGTGAVLGQVIGGNTGSTLAGAAIGGLAGAAIGNNEEKKSRRYYRDERGYTYYIGSDGGRYYTN
jgi:outer membrane lipoprotein SlyB